MTQPVMNLDTQWLELKSSSSIAIVARIIMQCHASIIKLP